MINELVQQSLLPFTKGGPIMWILLGINLLIWFLLANYYQFKTLKPWQDSALKSMLTIAPLLGLLGTVSGMISTFDGLAYLSSGGSQSGVSLGVSQALYTTQMGLVVSVPGLICYRLLIKKFKKSEVSCA